MSSTIPGESVFPLSRVSSSIIFPLIYCVRLLYDSSFCLCYYITCIYYFVINIIMIIIIIGGCIA